MARDYVGEALQARFLAAQTRNIRFRNTQEHALALSLASGDTKFVGDRPSSPERVVNTDQLVRRYLANKRRKEAAAAAKREREKQELLTKPRASDPVLARLVAHFNRR